MRASWPPLPMAIGLLAVVGDAVGGVDLANHVPVGLVIDCYETAFLLELFLQVGTFPVEGEEGLSDLGRHHGMQVVRMAIAGSREGGRLVDRNEAGRIDDL